MANYSNKTCYDCGVRKPANEMERVTESYNSGRSDRRPDAANVAGFIFSDAKTSRKMIKGALTKNNRRVYTRNRTVWKCEDCSGTADWQRDQVRDYIQKAVKTITKGHTGSMFSEAKQLPDSVNEKLVELRELDGTRSNKTARQLFEQIEFLVKTAPASPDSPARKAEREFDAKGGWTRIFNNFAMFITGLITVPFAMMLLTGEVTVDHPDFVKTMPFVAIFAFTLIKRRSLKKEYLRQTC